MSIISHIKNKNHTLTKLFLEDWKRSFVEQARRLYRCDLKSPNEIGDIVFETFQEQVLAGTPSRVGLSDEDAKILLTKLADRELILFLVRESHHFTLDYLYQKHIKMFLQRAVYKFKTKKEDGEDAYQEAFLGFVSNTLKGKLTELTTDLKWYLCQIFDYKIINIINKNKKREKPFDKLENSIESSYNIFESKIEKEAQQKKVAALLNQLDKECRELLILYYYNNYDMSSIARDLKYANANSAKSKKYKCLQKLINLMG